MEFLCTRKLKITPEKNYQACNIQNVCLYMGSSKQIHAIKCNTFNRYWGDSLFNALQANTFRGNTWKCSLQNETFNKYASQELSHWVCFNLKWMLFFFFERACHIFQCLSPKPTNLACWIFLIFYLTIWIEPNTHIICICLQIAISIGSFNDFSQCLNCTKGKVVSKVNMLNFPNIYTLKHDDNIF